MNSLRVCLLLFALALLPASAMAVSFKVEGIEVNGIKKIAVGTVLNYLPLKVGDTFDYADSPKVIRELYQTGFFDAVELYKDGGLLVVEVRERPAIAEVNIEGNRELNDDIMQDALKQTGLTKGKIYNPRLLEKLKQELEQLYFSLGKYSARLDVSATELDEDRVQIDIDISEGLPALIRSINLTGNDSFEDDELLDEFKLKPTDDAWFGADEYSSTKLVADLEALKSFYLDRGYVRFEVVSKQVSITPDKKDINIAVNLFEGEQYTINSLDFTGDLIVDRSELEALFSLREGDVYSRKEISSSINLMRNRLGEEGYAYAEIQALPEVDDELRTVALKLVVQPGDKMTVRRIEFEGNEKTREYVLRREMRQMESARFDQAKVDRSKVRLQRLKFVGSVDTRFERVAGSSDQMDIIYTVSERFSGSFTVGLGYSQAQGALFNLGLTHDNIFGSGNQVSFVFNNNDAQEQYEFSYVNPYYTPQGVSRGFSMRYTSTDASEANISNYLLDNIQLAINYGIPLSEYNQISFSLGIERNDVTISEFSSDEVRNFIIDNNDRLDASSDFDEEIYDTVFASMSFSTDSRNRLIFPDSGSLNSIGIEVHGGDLEFYKSFYRHQTVFPLWNSGVTFSFKGLISYGDAYGDTTDLPFFTKYTAGGIRTVRGYDYNSLGPTDSKGDVFGGNYRVVTNSEFLFPVEALGSAESFRLGLYFDAGNVFADSSEYDTSDLRTSVGVSLKWFTLIGPIQLSYAFPINDEAGDDTRNFQFSLGALF